MALDGADLIMLQRSGALRSCRVDELANKMTSSDLIVVQRGSGSGLMRKCAWGNIDSSLQGTDLLMVSDASNSHALRKTTFADLQGFLTVTRTIASSNNGTSTNEELTLDDIFTSAELSSTVDKKIVIESGAIVGSNNHTVAALSISTTNTLNGTVTVENNGHIVGKSGRNGNSGGPALTTSNTFALINNGIISGGGGQGGTGGTGGNGSATTNLGSGNGSTSSCDASCTSTYGSGAYCDFTTSPCTALDELRGLCTAGSNIINYNCSISQAPNCSPLDQLRGTCPSLFYCNLCYGTTTTTGGAGGAGGTGAGYHLGLLNLLGSLGSSGSAGGTNAGAGGDGGSGGGLGGAGATGATGANGNAGSGSAGSAGTAAGDALSKNGNTVTVTGSGTLNGNISS